MSSSSSSSFSWLRQVSVVAATCILLNGQLVESFQPSLHYFSTLSATATLSDYRYKTTLCMVRRGKGSIGKETGSDENGSESGMGMGSGSSSNSNSAVGNINWTPITVSVKSLPTEENKVTLIDTNLITMKNAQTNPTGAVSVIQYKKQMHCFAVNCPSCQIPLIKATCIPGNEESDQQPILQCDLCKATYNIKTGDKLTSSNSNQKVGIMGNIVKSIFSSKITGPLKVYKLAEKNGKLLIAGLD